MTSPYNIVARVNAVKHVGKDLVVLRLDAPDIASNAMPGQFVMLGPLDPASMDPFLCRPLSIYRTSQEGELDLLIAVVGRGTSLLTDWTEGMRVELIGPLGHGFELADQTRRILMVGGGVGVAPLACLASSPLSRGCDCTLFYGTASAKQLVDLRWLEDSGCQVHVATDDGSGGYHGLVTDLLVAQLHTVDRTQTLVTACGPWPMLNEVARLCSSYGVEAQVSMENRMACGTGACMGCSLMIAGKPQRVCKQGPVFAAKEVFD